MMFGPSQDLMRRVETQPGPAPVTCYAKLEVVRDVATSRGPDAFMGQSITQLGTLCGGGGNSVTLDRSQVTCPECRARF
jgi:hypothetical protein